MTTKGLTLAQVRKLPATVDVPTAARALGIGKSTLYEAIKLGSSPVKTLTVQRRVDRAHVRPAAHPRRREH